MTGHGLLHRRVLDWYAVHARPLPWREPNTTAWGVLVSEVMAQQTPVARVDPQWRQWLQRWPTPADLAGASPGDAVRAWGRLGYPRRALRLHEAAQAIVERHAGVVPEAVAELLALPGVGTYTAAAVACFAHGIRVPVVDTNVRRVLARALTGAALAAPSLTAAEARLAEAALPLASADAVVWNVAVMELGALVCTSRSPACERCPITDLCAWYAAGRPHYAGPPRRAQAWQGTDRQARGAIVQALREAAGPVGVDRLTAAWPDERQRQRCLDTLVADGLIEPLSAGRFRLPERSRHRSD